MDRNSLLNTALLCLAAVCCSSAQAQKMYRCGSNYQDHPCEGADAGREVRNFGAAPTATPDSGDSQCRQRGIDSQKIVWSREAGASAEKLMADVAARHPGAARAADEQNLITEVYRKRGSAPEVRAAIEADCVEEKRQAVLFAEAVKAQSKLSAGASSAPAHAPDIKSGPTRP